MRLAFGKFVTAVLLLSILSSDTALRSQVAAGPALTLGLLIEELGGLVKSIETAARGLMEQGNTSLAQQQLLVAATLERTIKNVQTAYKDSLRDTHDKMSTEEKNVYDGLKSLADSVQGIEKQINGDLSDRVFQTQSAANQLLDRLPFASRSPILIGAKIKGFLNSYDQNDADIALLGYLLSDNLLGYKKPEVKINGETIPSQFIGAFYDRVNIQIPDALKQKIRFDNRPCEPRKTFHIEVAVHYLKPWISLTKWGSENTVTLSMNSLSGRVLYDVRMRAAATRSFLVPEPAAFSNRSAYISVGCESSASTTVSWNIPKDAQQLNGSARWVNTDNLKQESANATPNGTTIVAQGTIVGLDTQGFIVKNCPGGGHGTLEVFGTYYLDKQHQEPFEYPQTSTLINDNGHVNFSLPAEIALPASTSVAAINGWWSTVLNQPPPQSHGGFLGQVIDNIARGQWQAQRAVAEAAKAQAESAALQAAAAAIQNALKSTLDYHSISVEVYRKDCERLLDRIVLNVPTDPNQKAEATSQGGFFRANIWKGQVVVEKVADL